MNNTRYARSGLLEVLRQALRMIDFLLLLFFLQRLGVFSSLRAVRQNVLVELGPGPTRLIRLKSLLLKDVRLVDRSDFGKPDKRLRLFDLNSCEDLEKLLCNVIGFSRSESIFLFADHCIEHLKPEIVSDLFRSLSRAPVATCFRVPNILSPRGQLIYSRDSTHKTSFDVDFRETLGSLGFRVVPFVRWYRPVMIFPFVLQPAKRMSIADEIMIYKQSGVPQV